MPDIPPAERSSPESPNDAATISNPRFDYPENIKAYFQSPWEKPVTDIPESPNATFTGEGRILRFVCHDIRRLSPAGLRWLYDWMGDTFDLRNR